MLHHINPFTLLALLAVAPLPSFSAPSPPASTTSLLPIHTPSPIPLPEGVATSSLAHSGPGCPPGTVAAALTLPFYDATLTYNTSAFLVSNNPDSLKATTCTTKVTIDYPAGWRFAVTTSAYEIAVDTGFDVKVTASAAYSITGVDNASANNKAEIVGGPKKGVYTVPEWKFVNMLVWSPCGATSAEVNVDASLSIEGTAVGEAALQGQYLGLSWMPCL
ncbi:hypothetical protein B0T14DRAFT_531209 [Immersiella caudata]|uniref:Uncharacterized protein n=1 Tax=Immersiella caudata TaxID=314043 RepID=A0AA39TT95_9PEZI|nr:hypothetical protein B0T14DRAFT_531209 [Immersiella caudata]